MIFDRDILVIGIAITVIFVLLTLFIVFFVVLFQRNRHINLEEKKQIYNSFQQELLKTQLETQEQTFHQIGEELHDNIGQLLSSARMLIGIAERSLDSVPGALKTADQTLGKAIQDLRMLSKSLNMEWLHQFNVIDNLYAEVERINAAQMIRVDLFTSVQSLPLRPESRVMLFRIVQEALHNAMKHSQAQHVRVDISCDQEILVLIKDDGKGFKMESSGRHGLGLLNMNHRTSLLGGTISWTSLPGVGTEVRIGIPVQHPETTNS